MGCHLIPAFWRTPMLHTCIRAWNLWGSFCEVDVVVLGCIHICTGHMCLFHCAVTSAVMYLLLVRVCNAPFASFRVCSCFDLNCRGGRRGRGRKVINYHDLDAPEELYWWTKSTHYYIAWILSDMLYFIMYVLYQTSLFNSATTERAYNSGDECRMMHLLTTYVG